MQQGQEQQQQLLADNTQLRYLLAQTEKRALERIEEIQRKQLVAAQDERKRLPGQKKQKQLPEKKKQKQRPARSGIVESVLLTAVSAVAGAAVGLGLGLRLSDGDRKRLPPKEVGTYFELAPVLERKRLPPKRD